MDIITSKEDREEHQKTYGTYIDNVTLKVAKSDYEYHVTVGVFKLNEGGFRVYAGQDFKTAITADGANYSEALEKLLKVL